MAMHRIPLPDDKNGGGMSALVVPPRISRGGAVVVIQEIFGVNGTMRTVCGRVADLGFTAICPDLFWRLSPGIDLDDGKPADFSQALAYMQSFDQDAGVRDLCATLAYARTLPGGNGRAGTIGYCLGGRMAMLMAMRSDADVNVSYYGVGLDNLIDGLGQVRAPLLLHVAGEDGFFPAAGRAALMQAVHGHPHITAWNYPGADHAFAREGGAHYDGLHAAIANGRSAEALGAALQR